MERVTDNSKQFFDHLPFSTGANGDVETVVFMLIGATLLLFGRKLYWFVVAAAGFAAGTLVGHEVFPQEPDWVLIVAPLAVGMVAAILSIFLQKLALRLAGMIAGGFLGYTVAEVFLAKPWPLLALVIGCLLGFWMVMVLFDWALIMLSSLSGTALISLRVPLAPEPQAGLALVLFIIGIAVQGSMQKKAPAPRGQPKPA
jgi:F0F1-type ATP synthase assembly protein I